MQTWEYCELFCNVEIIRNEYRDYMGEMKEKYTYAVGCFINYFNDGNNNYLQLNDRNDIVNENNCRFDDAMRALGQAGWELVNIQHGNENIYTFSGSDSYTYSESKRDNNLLYYNKIAYFKRPKIEGRKFDINEINL
jgi:hypothetical protein